MLKKQLYDIQQCYERALRLFLLSHLLYVPQFGQYYSTKHIEIKHLKTLVHFKKLLSALSRMYLGIDRMISFMPNYWDSIYNGSNFLVIIAWCKSKRHIWLLFDLILEQMVCNWMFQTSMEQLMDIKIWYSLALLRHIIW